MMRHFRAVAWVALAALMPSCGNTDATSRDSTPCETYCSLVLRRCTKRNLVFDSLPPCLAACATFSTAGQSGDTRGDTLQCRLTWALAAGREPFPFCAAAAPSGSTQCN